MYLNYKNEAASKQNLKLLKEAWENTKKLTPNFDPIAKVNNDETSKCKFVAFNNMDELFKFIDEEDCDLSLFQNENELSLYIKPYKHPFRTTCIDDNIEIIDSIISIKNKPFPIITKISNGMKIHFTNVIY